MVKLSIPNNLSTKNLIKKLKFQGDKVTMSLAVKNIPLTMDGFPNTRKILKKHLPSIFRCQCFNPNNLSFYAESKTTEIGHLFEHIILEYMCMAKIAYTEEISYSGKTSWNSDKMTGNFRVEIECGAGDYPVFKKALRKGIKLMDLIISEDKILSFGTQRKQTIKTVPFVD